MNERLFNFLKQNENINYSVLESLLAQIKPKEEDKEEETEPTKSEETIDSETEQENNINQAKSIADSLKDSI